MDYNDTIKGVLVQFKNSLFNPRFYKSLKNETIRDVYNYMARFALFITAASVLFIIITTFTQVQPNLYLLMFTVGIPMAAFAVYFVVFGIWIITGWILGLVFWVLTSWFTKDEPQDVIKQALYATGLPCIFIPFMKELHLSYSILIIIPAIILFINIVARKILK